MEPPAYRRESEPVAHSGTVASDLSPLHCDSESVLSSPANEPPARPASALSETTNKMPRKCARYPHLQFFPTNSKDKRAGERLCVGPEFSQPTEGRAADDGLSQSNGPQPQDRLASS